MSQFKFVIQMLFSVGFRFNSFHNIKGFQMRGPTKNLCKMLSADASAYYTYQGTWRKLRY